MAFIQIIDYRTSKYEEVERLGQEWEEAAAESGSTARRRVLVRDRDVADRYLNIVFFDSYEEAMQNSDNPVTQEFAGKMAELVDSPPTFLDLDVIEDIEL
jgi:hypothetical protein